MAVQAVTAGGGVLFREVDGPEVLLIFRRGVWDLPKGKMEEGETAEECAVREVAEEVGCPLPENLGKLTETYHEYSEGGEKIGKTTHWYAMRGEESEGFTPQRDEGIEKVRWFPLDRARQVVGFDNLVTVLTSFEQWIESR